MSLARITGRLTCFPLILGLRTGRPPARTARLIVSSLKPVASAASVIVNANLFRLIALPAFNVASDIEATVKEPADEILLPLAGDFGRPVDGHVPVRVSDGCFLDAK